MNIIFITQLNILVLSIYKISNNIEMLYVYSIKYMLYLYNT